MAAQIDLLLVGAVSLEVRPFAGRLGVRAADDEVVTATAGRWCLALLAAGIGRRGDATFRRALEELRPAAALNVGFAGALDTDLAPGDAVTVTEWRRPEPPPALAARPHASLVEWTADALDHARLGAGGVAAVTLDHALGDAVERDRLRRDSDARVVEMEGAAWAAIAAAARVPFAAVRVVSDHADRPLPGSDAMPGKRAWILRPDGSVRPLRLARALLVSGEWRRPLRRLRDVRRAGHDWARAWRGLEAAAEALVDHLPSLADVFRLSAR